ncbi:MAG: hypothetical protein WDN75_14805 [Bacteroidota bacterium]
MPTSSGYILLLCDDDEISLKARKILGELAPTIPHEIAVDLDQLMKKIREKAPHFILIYLCRDDHSYTSYVKDLRKNIDVDKVPIFIYYTLPEKEEIHGLLEKYG